MSGPPAHPTLELPAASQEQARGATQPPPHPPTPPVVYGSGPRRWLEWSLGVALVVVGALAVWQFNTAADARAQLTSVEDRIVALEDEVEALRADNEALQATNEELRASAESGDPLTGILAPLLRGETPTEEELLELLLPLLRERLGEGFGELGDLFRGGDLGGLGDLGDLFGNN